MTGVPVLVVLRLHRLHELRVPAMTRWMDRFLCWLGRPRAVVAGRDCYCRACGEVIRTATGRKRASTEEEDVSSSRHDCGHVCCDERSDPLHDHFLRPSDCPRCASTGREQMPRKVTKVVVCESPSGCTCPAVAWSCVCEASERGRRLIAEQKGRDRG